ncbi:hypothetical protein ASG29_04800 [Sphingomonas sp. Leaf412]|uniref:hypothetical protein n=1 Tax=Sphingomonas sp. Leaf412 TaxID=1736370 RepID=UPI000701E678|nr:hypothetical protein [Sphingomonas sp. Leaf412]KQT33380.1 hypothetical protein ASG29_04800 [Sphingomonas sp. Leaf412]
MGAIEGRTFRSGDGVAVRLPDALGFAPDTRVTIERVGDHVEIRAAPTDPAEEGRKLAELVAALQALAPMPAAAVGRREPIEFPDRPGLYR